MGKAAVQGKHPPPFSGLWHRHCLNQAGVPITPGVAPSETFEAMGEIQRPLARALSCSGRGEAQQLLGSLPMRPQETTLPPPPPCLLVAAACLRFERPSRGRDCRTWGPLSPRWPTAALRCSPPHIERLNLMVTVASLRGDWVWVCSD